MLPEKTAYFGLFTLLLLVLNGSTGQNSTDTSLASLDLYIRLLWTDIHAALQILLQQQSSSVAPAMTSLAVTSSTLGNPSSSKPVTTNDMRQSTSVVLSSTTTPANDRISPLQKNATCTHIDLEGNCCNSTGSCQLSNSTSLCDHLHGMVFDMESEACLHMTSLDYCYWLILAIIYTDCSPYTSLDLSTFKCVNSYDYDLNKEEEENNKWEICEAFQIWLMDKEDCVFDVPKIDSESQRCPLEEPLLLLPESNCCQNAPPADDVYCGENQSLDLRGSGCVANPPEVFNITELYYDESFPKCPSDFIPSLFHLGDEVCTWDCGEAREESTTCEKPFVWNANQGICTYCFQGTGETVLDQCSVPGLAYNLQAGCFSNAFDSNECSYSCVACSSSETLNTAVCPSDQVYCVSCDSCVPKPNIAQDSFMCKEGYSYCFSSELCRSQPFWRSYVEGDDEMEDLVPNWNRTECSLPRNLTLVFKKNTCSKDSDCAWDSQCCLDPGSRNRQCVRFDGSVSSESAITVTTVKPASSTSQKPTPVLFNKPLKIRIQEAYNKTVGSRKVQFLNTTRHQLAALVRIPTVCFVRMNAIEGSVVLGFDMSNEASPSTDVASAYDQLAALLSQGNLQIYGVNASQLSVPPQTTDGVLIAQQDDNSQVIIIGVVVGCICVIILLIAVGCIIWKNKKQTVVRSFKPMSQGALQPVYRSFPYEGSLEGSELNVARLRAHLPAHRPPRNLDDLQSDDPAYLNKLAESYDIPKKLSNYELKRSWQDQVTPAIPPRVFTTSGGREKDSALSGGSSSAELMRNWSRETTPDAAKYRTPSRGLAKELLDSLTPRPGNRKSFVSYD